ncbi:hypothetical protein EU527_05065 [Candidatus Thorarchaeota archaeon]|nr:MAG: hypothetical protein EU527_05065 [Candidatus Thorarchaeota archaeon]
MTNKEKSLKRDRTRLRKSQNPQQVDYKQMGKKRSVRTEFWKLKKRGGISDEKTGVKKTERKEKPAKEPKKKEKEPELEVIEEEPELEIIEEEPEIEELDDLYSYDDDIDEDSDVDEEIDDIEDDEEEE